MTLDQRIAAIKREIAELQAILNRPPTRRRTFKRSAATRRKMSLAQRERYRQLRRSARQESSRSVIAK